MKNKNKKLMIIIVISFYVLINFNNSCECSSYSEWLSSFIQLLNVGSSIDEKEDALIKAHLEIRPDTIDTDFNRWFPIFRQKLNVGSMLSNTEAKVLNYLIESRPETSGEEYLYFLQLLDNNIKQTGPILDETEKKILDFIIRIKPAKIISKRFSDFEKEYLRKYDIMVKHFGNINETDALLLTYFKQAKPEGMMALTIEDPLFQELNILLLSSTTQLTNALLSNNYVLTEKMVNLIEFFYYRLKDSNNTNNNPKLDLLVKRLQNLK